MCLSFPTCLQPQLSTHLIWEFGTFIGLGNSTERGLVYQTSVGVTNLCAVRADFYTTAVKGTDCSGTSFAGTKRMLPVNLNESRHRKSPRCVLFSF